MNLVTPQLADPPPVCLKTFLTWHRAHTPSSERGQAIQRLAGGVDSWPPVWPHHTRSQTHTHCTCVRCIRLLDGALLWPGWACKVRGYWGRGVTLSLPSEPRWRGRAEQSMHIVLDRALGPTGSFDRHLSNKAITDHTQCEPLPHVLRNFT